MEGILALGLICVGIAGIGASIQLRDLKQRIEKLEADR